MFLFLTNTVRKSIFIDRHIIFYIIYFTAIHLIFREFNRLFDEQAETYLMSKSQLIRYGIKTDENVISNQYVFTP